MVLRVFFLDSEEDVILHRKKLFYYSRCITIRPKLRHLCCTSIPFYFLYCPSPVLVTTDCLLYLQKRREPSSLCLLWVFKFHFHLCIYPKGLTFVIHQLHQGQSLLSNLGLRALLKGTTVAARFLTCYAAATTTTGLMRY